MSGRGNDELLFCNVRSLTFCLVTDSRNSTPKWKVKNLQATRTVPSFIFRAPRCRRASNALTTPATWSWVVHRKWRYVTIFRCYFRFVQLLMENVSGLSCLKHGLGMWVVLLTTDIRILNILSQAVS